MFLNGTFFGIKAVSHEGNQIFHDRPVPSCPKRPQECRVGAGEVVIFECLVCNSLIKTPAII